MSTTRFSFLPLPVALTLGFALACGGSSSAPPAPPAAPAAPAAASGAIGVPECDEYLAKMTACLATMDAATRAQFEAPMNTTRDGWAKLAAMGQSDALKTSCQAAAAGIPANCSGGAAAAPAAGATAAAPAAAPAAGTPAAAPATGTTAAPATGTAAAAPAAAPAATTPAASTPAAAPAAAPEKEFHSNQRSPSMEEIRKQHRN